MVLLCASGLGTWTLLFAGDLVTRVSSTSGRTLVRGLDLMHGLRKEHIELADLLLSVQGGGGYPEEPKTPWRYVGVT